MLYLFAFFQANFLRIIHLSLSNLIKIFYFLKNKNNLQIVKLLFKKRNRIWRRSSVVSLFNNANALLIPLKGSVNNDDVCMREAIRYEKSRKEPFGGVSHDSVRQLKPMFMTLTKIVILLILNDFRLLFPSLFVIISHSFSWLKDRLHYYDCATTV